MAHQKNFGLRNRKAYTLGLPGITGNTQKNPYQTAYLPGQVPSDDELDDSLPEDLPVTNAPPTVVITEEHTDQPPSVPLIQESYTPTLQRKADKSTHTFGFMVDNEGKIVVWQKTRGDFSGLVRKYGIAAEKVQGALVSLKKDGQNIPKEEIKPLLEQQGFTIINAGSLTLTIDDKHYTIDERLEKKRPSTEYQIDIQKYLGVPESQWNIPPSPRESFRSSAAINLQDPPPGESTTTLPRRPTADKRPNLYYMASSGSNTLALPTYDNQNDLDSSDDEKEEEKNKLYDVASNHFSQNPMQRRELTAPPAPPRSQNKKDELRLAIRKSRKENPLNNTGFGFSMHESGIISGVHNDAPFLRHIIKPFPYSQPETIAPKALLRKKLQLCITKNGKSIYVTDPTEIWESLQKKEDAPYWTLEFRPDIPLPHDGTGSKKAFYATLDAIQDGTYRTSAPELLNKHTQPAQKPSTRLTSPSSHPQENISETFGFLVDHEGKVKNVDRYGTLFKTLQKSNPSITPENLKGRFVTLTLSDGKKLMNASEIRQALYENNIIQNICFSSSSDRDTNPPYHCTNLSKEPPESYYYTIAVKEERIYWQYRLNQQTGKSFSMV